MYHYQVSTPDNIIQDTSANKWVHYVYKNGIEMWVRNPVISFVSRSGIVHFAPGKWDVLVLKSYRTDRSPWVQAFSPGIITMPKLGQSMSLIDGFGNDAVYWNARSIDPVSQYSSVPLTQRSESLFYKNNIASAYVGSSELSVYYDNPQIEANYTGPTINGYDSESLRNNYF